MSWQIAADIREMFVEIAATDGDKLIFGRNLNRKDQLTSGLTEAVGQLTAMSPGFKPADATLFVTSDYDRIALRERWGSHAAFLTTEGFENVLEIGTQQRTDQFGLHPVKNSPLISRDVAFGVTERTRFDGSIEVGLDDKEIEFVLSKLAITDVKAVAICLLHSNKNPAHEKHLAGRLAEKGYEVVCSHEFKGDERERAAQACAQAFVVTGRQSFAQDIQKLGFAADRIFVKSAAPLKTEAREIVCEFLEDRIRVHVGGEVWESPTSPLSLVVRNDSGLVHVGPRKIESEPGPVCFGKGITLSLMDAIALLSKMKPQSLSRLKYDTSRSAKQFAPLAKQLQLDSESCVKKFVNLAYDQMALEFKRRWGRERFSGATVIGEGWLAPLMTAPLARRLGAAKYVVPKMAGFSSCRRLLEKKSAAVSEPATTWGTWSFETGASSEGETFEL